MENQGYEDESSVCTISCEFLPNEETSKLEKSLRRVSLTEHSDAHVYEDISSDHVNSPRLPVQNYECCATFDVGHNYPENRTNDSVLVCREIFRKKRVDTRSVM